MALLRPEKALTEEDSLAATRDEVAAKAAGAAVMEAATMDAIAAERPSAAGAEEVRVGAVKEVRGY